MSQTGLALLSSPAVVFYSTAGYSRVIFMAILHANDTQHLTIILREGWGLSGGINWEQ